MAYVLPKLNYDYDALEPVIDARTMEIHHSKHHAKYIENLNLALEGNDNALDLPIESLLRQIETVVPADKQTAVRNNGGGHANHSLFWEIMAPGGATLPSGDLLSAIEACCEDFATFKTHFAEKAAAQFGSGWGWLVANKDGQVEIITTANQDSPLMQGKTPILGVDVWEHAYYLKYQNRRPDYLAAWWDVVNWDVVTEKYSVVRGS